MTSDFGIVRIVYHRTAVVVYWPDGTFALNTGGWHTATTTAKMRLYGPPGQYARIKGRVYYNGRPVQDGERLLLPPAPEQDWRPTEVIPEDYYAL
jgi:hypothetical protein